jgi:hypothetical protein
VLEEIAINSGLGIVMDSPDEVAQYLNKIILTNRIEPDLEKLRQFEARIQVKNLTKSII